jgi:SAM-dependent methyltransferase
MGETSKTEFDVVSYNRKAWDREVDRGNEWTVPVSAEQVAAARRGELQLLLTPTRPVPQSWLGELAGARVLGLAAAGGQQGPLLAAAGAEVTILDNSPRQLDQDRLVALREELELRTELGTMTDLSRFADDSFDLIVHPVSNLFVPDVRPVWRECARVLLPGGALLAGFDNPAQCLFDVEAETRGELVVRHRLPYSDRHSLPAETLRLLVQRGDPLEHGHSLEDQIGGQTAAGLQITGFYEDIQPGRRLCDFMPIFVATRAIKPR